MKPDEILSQVLFWGIACFSAVIAYEFYNTKNGKLRILIIELFLAKIWVYGGAGIYFLMQDFGWFVNLSPIWVRVILNAPMFLVMVRLYKFVRTKK